MKKKTTASIPLLNRELGTLSFIYRVLLQAEQPGMPILEQLNYLTICSSLLDEFFEVRVANVKNQLTHGLASKRHQTQDIPQLLATIRETVLALLTKQYHLLNEQVLPQLAQQDIHLLPQAKWLETERLFLKEYFHNDVLPLLSPIALDPAHPFPRLINKCLCFVLSLEGADAFGRETRLAVVHTPRALQRLITLPTETKAHGRFVYLSEVIGAFADKLFPGMRVTGCYQFRITRNSDLAVDEDHIDDLTNAITNQLQLRRFGHAVRLEIAKNCPQSIIDFLLEQHELSVDDAYFIDGPVNLSRYRILYEQVERPDLCFKPFFPRLSPDIRLPQQLFDAVSQQDILFMHPFHSFTPVIELIRQAAADPMMLAIKVTLYRCGTRSKLVKALIAAALAGKEVTVVIELRARMDEAENLELANQLQAAGAVVVYGVMGYKCHAKLILMIRKEGDKLRRYAHLGTGNYHAGNAKLYTDIGLLTKDKEITRDVQSVFQQLTGMGKMLKLKQLLAAPFTFLQSIVAQIDTCIESAKAKQTSHIVFKINHITEPTLINALYRASQAGVKVSLIVRGACCLKPGVPGLSENIEVRSIIGRFLEHSRIYYFHHQQGEPLYCASADAMERNYHRRIEVAFPILDSTLHQRIKEDALFIYLRDDITYWALQSDGSYTLNNGKHEVQSLIAARFGKT